VSPGTNADRPDEGELYCFWCNTPLADDGRCASCGRRQTRVCFCGEELWPDQELCPNCGADWAGVVKVRRRKRRHSVSSLGVLRATALGILIALMATAIINSVVGRLALDSAEGNALPEAPAERLGLAWKTVADTIAAMCEAFGSRVGGVAFIALLGLAGGLVGAFLYLRREGMFRPRWRNDHPAAPIARKRRMH